jgi:hypothetical protein
MNAERLTETTLPFRLARELGLEFGYERSFRMSEGVLLWERYLLGIDRASIAPGILGLLLDRVGFPACCRHQFETALPDANLILLGYEQGERNTVLKVYLEFWDKIKAEVLRAPGDLSPRLMFLGFKWDAQAGGSERVTRYQCFPRLPLEDTLSRIAGLMAGCNGAVPMPAIEALVRLAAQRGPAAAFKYLEASEEGNPRRSFDLNLYSANLRLREVFPIVAGLGRHYRIAPGILAQRFAAAGEGIFGHISAGLDRQGRDFFSLYYEPAGAAQGKR